MASLDAVQQAGPWSALLLMLGGFAVTFASTAVVLYGSAALGTDTYGETVERALGRTVQARRRTTEYR